MLTARKRAKMQWILGILGIGLVAYYLGVYRPLSRKADQLDRPLVKVWQDLLASSPEGSVLTRSHLTRIDVELERAQSRLAEVEALGKLMARRVAVDPVTQERLQQPFQHIDFQNERQVLVEQLARQAEERKVELGSGVLEGFPEYSASNREAWLLWAQLDLVRRVVSGAIQAQVGQVTAIDLLPPILYRRGGGSNRFPDLVEVSMRVRMAGSAEAVTQLLEGLPLLTEEMKERGLPAAGEGKPALFVHRVLMRKERPDKLDWVDVDLETGGFIFVGLETPEVESR